MLDCLTSGRPMTSVLTPRRDSVSAVQSERRTGQPTCEPVKEMTKYALLNKERFTRTDNQDNSDTLHREYAVTNTYQRYQNSTRNFLLPKFIKTKMTVKHELQSQDD